MSVNQTLDAEELHAVQVAPAATPYSGGVARQPCAGPVCAGAGWLGSERKPEVCDGCGGAKYVDPPLELEAIRRGHHLAAALATYRDAVRARSRWLEGWRSNTLAGEQQLIDAETAAQNQLVTAIRAVMRPAWCDALVMDVESGRGVDGGGSGTGLEPGVRAER